MLSTFFSFIGFDSPSILVGPDDIKRVAFTWGAAPANVVYAECAAHCGLVASWASVTLDTASAASETRLLRGSDGRLHLLYHLDGNNLYYGTTRPAPAAAPTPRAGRRSSCPR